MHNTNDIKLLSTGFPEYSGDVVDFKTMLNWYIKQAEKALADSLPQINTENNAYGKVIEAMAYSLEAGGKRIRPMLVLEFCRITGGNLEQALPIACAIEFIHTFSLIHDDLPCMDNDDLRRGKPSCHKKFDEGIALLAGDSLAIYPFEYVTKTAKTTRLSAEKTMRIVEILSELSGVSGMIGGQTIDISNAVFDEKTLLSMYSMKTSRLLKAACCMGCVVGNATDEQFHSANVFAENIGLAFQIIDDILDVEGDEKLLGKPIGSDFGENKTTYVTLMGIQNAKKMAEKLTENAISALNSFDDKKFLLELTQTLLKRKK